MGRHEHRVEGERCGATVTANCLHRVVGDEPVEETVEAVLVDAGRRDRVALHAGGAAADHLRGHAAERGAARRPVPLALQVAGVVGHGDPPGARPGALFEPPRVVQMLLADVDALPVTLDQVVEVRDLGPDVAVRGIDRVPRVDDAAGLVRRPPGEEGTARRHAQRRRAVAALEANALVEQSVDVRGVRSKGVPAELVGHQHDQVRPSGHGWMLPGLAHGANCAPTSRRTRSSTSRRSACSAPSLRDRVPTARRRLHRRWQTTAGGFHAYRGHAPDRQRRGQALLRPRIRALIR